MFFFDHILNPPKAGRHTEAGIIRRLQAELAKLRTDRDAEVRGYQQALQQAGRDVLEARTNSDKHLHLFRQADAEVQRLTRLLRADVQLPAAPPQPALADDPTSWINQPDPAPVTEGPRAVADTPTVEATYEPADPAAETQAVPQVEQTQVMPIAVVEEATDADATQVMPIVVPVVALDPVPRTTWGVDPETAQIEAALSLPGPPPGAGASEISMATGLTAVTKVHAVVAQAAP